MTVEGSVEPAPINGALELITLEELTARVGETVRNVRFYTSRGLIPPPIRQGRSGYYTRDHLARLQLVKELQAHGFTLAAIEKYLARIPADARPDEIAVHRVTLQPWLVEQSQTVTLEQLAEAAGRPLAEAELERLQALDVIADLPGEKFLLRANRLSTALPLLDLEMPVEVMASCNEIYARHGRAMAEELLKVFQRLLWPAYRTGELSADQLVRILEAFQPTSVTALVEAFSHAMTEVRREAAEKRTQ